MNRFQKALVLGLVAFPVVGSAQAVDPTFQKNMDAYLASEGNVEKLAGVIIGFAQKKQAAAQEQQMKQQQKADTEQLEENFKNPTKVDIGKAPIKGNADAKITIVEFSDFQCPFCQRGASVMEEVMKKYPNEVKIAFKHLPLPFHNEAKPAAKAAVAAQAQGKFWEMYAKLFENQQELGDAGYNKFAKEIGLDLAKFKADMASPATAKQVEDDMALANSLGVQGTPGFFVNGIQVRGARPAQHFEMIIERLKKEKKI